MQIMMPFGSMGTLKRAGIGAMKVVNGDDGWKSDRCVCVRKSNGAETGP